MADILECSRLEVRYGDVRALAGVDLSVPPGRVMGVLGPNGAGKTTLIQAALGLVRPHAGRMSVFGSTPGALGARVRTGAMMQIPGVPTRLRVRELIELFRGYYPNPLSPARVMAIAGVSDFSDRLYGRLSGGQQRRVQFALAICGDPELIFLDEPTAGMDVSTRRGFWRQVRELARAGRTILLTTHYLEEADALADEIVVLGRGRVLARGEPAEIKQRVAHRRIRCLTGLSKDRLASLPGCVRVGFCGQRADILTARPDDSLRDLLATDGRARDIEVTGTGLEEAFLSLTDETEQEAAA